MLWLQIRGDKLMTAQFISRELVIFLRLIRVLPEKKDTVQNCEVKVFFLNIMDMSRV